MHTASAMLGRAAAPCASPPPRAAPKAARGSAARPLRAAARKTTPEAAENELAALKRQVEQADALINAGRLAEAEQVLGCVVALPKPPNSAAFLAPARPVLTQPPAGARGAQLHRAHDEARRARRKEQVRRPGYLGSCEHGFAAAPAALSGLHRLCLGLGQRARAGGPRSAGGVRGGGA